MLYKVQITCENVLRVGDVLLVAIFVAYSHVRKIEEMELLM